MSINHIFEYKDGITIIRFSAMPTLDEAKVVIDKLAKEKSYHFRLWDFDGIQFKFTLNEVRSIAEYGKSKFKEKNFFAAVAPQDLAYGTLRAFEVYRQEEGQSNVRVFRTEQKAIEWLMIQSELWHS